MSWMFFNTGGNKSLDLSEWDTSNVTNMTNMFKNSKNLKTIYVSDLWNTSKVTSSTSMFEGCTSLVGGNGTVYSSSYTDKTYARIDTPETPGYLTASANMKTYKLKTGLEFNALIPSTTTSIIFTDEVMPSDATLIDVDADGDGGVVGWLDGTTFKVSSQKPGRKIIANEDSSYMFSGDENNGNKRTVTRRLTSITGLENLDTSNVTNMRSMFSFVSYNTTTCLIEGLAG